MPLILVTVVLFAMLGLASRRFGAAQQALVVVTAVALAVIQLARPGYL